MDRQGDDVNSSGSYHTPPANLGQDWQENFTHYPDLERPQFPQLPVLTAAILMYGRRLESEVSYLYTGGSVKLILRLMSKQLQGPHP